DLEVRFQLVQTSVVEVLLDFVHPAPQLRGAVSEDVTGFLFLLIGTRHLHPFALPLTVNFPLTRYCFVLWKSTRDGLKERQSWMGGGSMRCRTRGSESGALLMRDLPAAPRAPSTNSRSGLTRSLAGEGVGGETDTGLCSRHV